MRGERAQRVRLRVKVEQRDLRVGKAEEQAVAASRAAAAAETGCIEATTPLSGSRVTKRSCAEVIPSSAPFAGGAPGGVYGAGSSCSA